MTTFDRSHTIAQIVLDHPVTARVFQQNRIDFCCKGDRTVDQAAAERKVDADPIVAALQAAIAERAGQKQKQDLRELSVAAVIAHVIGKHHEYLRTQLPFLAPLASKVARVHGDKEPRLVTIRETFDKLSDALLPHLDQEEEVLFPALMSRTPDRAVIDREFEEMHRDHLEVGAMLEALRELSDDFEPPSWGCNSYRTLFKELEALEADILEHVHTENHVLMPRFAS